MTTSPAETPLLPPDTNPLPDPPLGTSGLSPDQLDAIRDYYSKMLCDFLHPGTKCNRNACHVWTSCFKASMAIYLPLYFLMALMAKRYPMYIVKRCCLASLRSSLFIATYCLMYSRLTCMFIRLIRNVESYRLAFFFGPLIASFTTVFIEKSSRRRELAVYMFNQAAETTFKLLLSRGYFTYTPFRAGKRFLFASAMGSMLYFYNWSSQDLAPNVLKICRMLMGSKTQRSQGDWIEYQVRTITKPILTLKNKSFSNLQTLFKQHTDENPGSNPLFTQVSIGGDLVYVDHPLELHVFDQPTETLPQNNDAPTTPSNQTHFPPISSDTHFILTTEDDPPSQKPLDPPEPTLPDTVEDMIPTYSSSRTMFWLNGLVRGFFFGYFVRAFSSLFPKLFSPLFLLRHPLQVLKKSFGKTALRSGCFVSILVGVSRLVKVSFTTLFKKDHPLIDFASGFAGGCCATTVQTSTEITLYTVGKVVEAIFQKLIRLRLVPSLSLSIELIYSISTTLLLYAAFLEPWTIRNSYKLFLSRATAKIYDNLTQSSSIKDVQLMNGTENLKHQYFKYKRS